MADLGPISSVALMPLALAAPNVPVGNRGNAISEVSPPEVSGGGGAVPGTLYLDNGRLKASLDGTPIAGGRLVAIET